MLKQRLIAFLTALCLITGCPNHSQAIVTNQNTQTITAIGNGVTTNYVIGFDFRDNSQVAVTKVNSSGTRTSIVYGSGASKFTISGGNPGTTVVMGTAPTSSEYLILNRSIPLTQPVAFDNNEPFPATDLGTQLDLLTMKMQDLNAAVTGVPGSSTVVSVGGSLPTALAYNFVGYNAAGSTITIPGTSTLSSNDILKFNGSAWSNYNLSASNLDGIINGGTTAIVPGAGGTGVSNGGLLTWGTHALTFSLTGDTSLTLPTSGTLIAGTTNTGNVGGTIVLRDGSGNSSHNVLTANSFVGALTGNVTGNVTGNTSGTASNVTGTVTIGHGGTGQTTQAAAITALFGTQTSGYFARSDGINTTLQPIGIGDVPQGFSRLKLHQATPNTAVMNDGSGNLTDLSAGALGNVMTSDGIEWISAPPGAALIGQGIAYGADVGVADAYVINPSPAILAYAAGLAVSFDAANANTGPATIDVNGFGLVAIKEPGGGALIRGDILAGQQVELIYDGVNFQMVSQQGPASVINTPYDIVKRNSNGDFAASTITASLIGHASLDLPLTGGTMSGAINMGASLINNLATPLVGTDAATKAYVDLITFNSLSPMTTLGDMEYESAANTASRLAGNTTSTKKFLTQTGTGAVSAAPGWSTILGSDLPNPSSSTLGGIQSYIAVSNQWINAISTSGVPSSSQPAFTDISGTLAIGQGGTGQTTAAAAFGALSPLGSKGNILGYSTINGAFGVGADGTVLTADSTQSFGMKWAAAGAPGNWSVVTKTGASTLTATDAVVLASTVGGAFTLTLPAASSNSGKTYFIKKIDTGGSTLTIGRTGADLIDGETSQTINIPYTGIVLISDGSSNWYGF